MLYLFCAIAAVEPANSHGDRSCSNRETLTPLQEPLCGSHFLLDLNGHCDRIRQFDVVTVGPSANCMAQRIVRKQVSVCDLQPCTKLAPQLQQGAQKNTQLSQPINSKSTT
jgi:hypothetical protein